MDSTPWKILMIDDDEDDYVLVDRMLSETRRRRYELEWVATYAEGLHALQTGGYDAVLVDYDLGAHSGIDLTRQAVACKVQAPIIL